MRGGTRTTMRAADDGVMHTTHEPSGGKNGDALDGADRGISRHNNVGFPNGVWPGAVADRVGSIGGGHAPSRGGHQQKTEARLLFFRGRKNEAELAASLPLRATMPANLRFGRSIGPIQHTHTPCTNKRRALLRVACVCVLGSSQQPAGALSGAWTRVRGSYASLVLESIDRRIGNNVGRQGARSKEQAALNAPLPQGCSPNRSTNRPSSDCGSRGWG